MGIVYVEGTVTGPTGKQATVNFLVDSGAMYTLLPRKVWRAIGLKPMDSIKCLLADGTEVERRVSECRISLPQGQWASMSHELANGCLVLRLRK